MKTTLTVEALRGGNISYQTLIMAPQQTFIKQWAKCCAIKQVVGHRVCPKRL